MTTSLLTHYCQQWINIEAIRTYLSLCIVNKQRREWTTTCLTIYPCIVDQSPTSSFTLLAVHNRGIASLADRDTNVTPSLGTNNPTSLIYSSSSSSAWSQNVPFRFIANHEAHNDHKLRIHTNVWTLVGDNNHSSLLVTHYVYLANHNDEHRYISCDPSAVNSTQYLVGDA